MKIKRKKKKQPDFTKKIVPPLLVIGIVNGTVPFILSAFGKEPVSEMGVVWVTEVVAVVLGYLCKSYFGKKEEEKTRLREKQLNSEEDLQFIDINSTDEGGE